MMETLSCAQCLNQYCRCKLASRRIAYNVPRLLISADARYSIAARTN